MHKSLPFILLLVQCVSFAQVARITYRMEILVDETVAADYYGEIKRRELKDVFKYTDFELVFDNKRACFSSPAILESDNIPFQEAAAYFNLDKPIYTDAVYRYIYGEPDLGIDELYLVKIPHYQWQLHPDSKIIEGYKCYKATYARPGADAVTHTAWYCPVIKSNFGPMGMADCPGMILEIEQGGYIFRATKVELKINDKIDFPTLLKVITEAEYLILWDEWERREMGKTFRE